MINESKIIKFIYIRAGKKAYNTGCSQEIPHPNCVIQLCGPTLLNFGDRTGTGAFSVVWS